jgi:2-polyprenyl-6-hydroxyphenyl methylase/3-demethylubiquinone-9 3-methyltransferase
MASQTEALQKLNADEIELKKFGELAHKWWDKNSEFKPLH